MNLLRALEIFCAVAEHESFTRAAKELSLAQPPLSRSIGDLEKHLKVQLFDRRKRQIRLTSSGRSLLPEAQDILRRIDGLSEIARPRHRELLIGVSGQLDPAALAAATAQLHIDGVAVRLSPTDSANLERLVGNGELDGGLDVRPLGAGTATSNTRIEIDLAVEMVAASPRFSESGGPIGIGDLRGMPPAMALSTGRRRQASEIIHILPEDRALLEDSRLLTPLVAHGVQVSQFQLAASEFEALTHVFAEGSTLLCTAATARKNSLPYRRISVDFFAKRIEVIQAGEFDLIDALHTDPAFKQAIAQTVGAIVLDVSGNRTIPRHNYADERMYSRP